MIFFPVELFLHSPAFPCCLKPHLPFPVSCSLSLSICLCLFFPCVRSPVVWCGSSFLSSPRAFSPIKEKNFFSTLLPFSSLCLSRPFLLSFDLHSRSSQMLLTVNSAVVFVMRTLRLNHFQRLNEVKELKILFFAQRANTRKQASSRRLLPCDALAPTAQNRASARCMNDTSAHRRPAAI